MRFVAAAPSSGRLFLFGEVDVDHVAVFRLTAEALSWLSRKSRYVSSWLRPEGVSWRYFFSAAASAGGSVGAAVGCAGALPSR